MKAPWLLLVLQIALGGCIAEVGGEDSDREASRVTRCSKSGEVCVGGAIQLGTAQALADWRKAVLDGMEPGMSTWQGGPGYSECRPVSQAPEVVFCNSDSRATMNRIFYRTECFLNGPFGNSPGTVIANDVVGSGAIAGYALRRADFVHFFEAASRRCKLEPSACLTQKEQAFHDTVLAPLLQREADFVVLAGDDSPGTFSHEMLHAQFFLDGAYADAVIKYWRSLTAAERQQVRDLLAPDYNVSNDRMVADEFQAYVLEHDSVWGLLGSVVERHRDALRQALAEAGLIPFEIDPS